MIAQRFKAVGWVAIVAIAATFLYLISLQVAVERGKLEAVEAQIVAAQRELRQLQTEMGTRASMRQLERWNGEVLALSAPKASQFVNNGAQLVALDLDVERATPNAPPPMMASAPRPKSVIPAVLSAPDGPVGKPTVKLANAKSAFQQVAMAIPITARDAAAITRTGMRKQP